MRSRLASWLSPLLLVGCSAEAPTARQPEPPPPVVSAPSAASAPVAPPMPTVPLALEVQAALRPVCVYQTTAGEVSAVDLYIPGSETRWATVLEGTIQTALPRTEQGQPVLSVDTPGVRVRAEGRLATIPFQLTRPKVFAGIAVPDSDRVTVAAVTASGLTLAMHKPAHLTSSAPFQETASCGDVAIANSSWTAASVLPDTSSAKRALLVTGIVIPVRATEDGAPVGELSFPKRRPNELGGWQQVLVVAESKASSRIVFRDAWGTVFGWVPKSATTPVPRPDKSAHQALREAAEFGMIGLLSGGSELPPAAPSPRDRVTCRRDVPLIVEVGSREVTMGVILSGVTMEVGATRGEVTRLLSSPPGLNPMEAARLFVSSAALAGCTRERAMSPHVEPHDGE